MAGNSEIHGQYNVTPPTRADGERGPVQMTALGYLLVAFAAAISGITAPTATLTGWLNAIVGAIYNATPTARTEGQWGPLQATTRGAVNANLDTKLAGEDQSNDVLKVEGQFSATNITTATTTTVKSGAGLYAGLIINKGVAAGVITIYDNTAASGTKLGTITFGAALLGDPPIICAPIGAKFSTGLTIVTSAATDITVLWR